MLNYIMLVVKIPPDNAEELRDVGLIPGLGRVSGERNDNPLLYSCMKIPWTEKPGRLQSWGCKESDTAE